MNFDTINRFLAGVAFALGLIFGSFLNVCIYRLPRGLSVVRPRSACPHCGKQIAAYDNIPVLSWLLLAGRCRHCHARITPRYVMVELLTGLLFLACYSSFGPTLQALKACSFSFLLLGLVFTDAETHLLPDKLTLTGLALGLLWSVVVIVPGPLGLWFEHGAMSNAPEITVRLLSLGDALIGAAVGAGFIYATGAIYLRLRGVEGMGFGDVKLMAMVGAFLGAPLALFVLVTASVAGGLYGLATMLIVFGKRVARYRRAIRSRKAAARAWQSASLVLRFHEMPFGVFLGSLALVALFFGERLLHWYLRKF